MGKYYVTVEPHVKDVIIAENHRVALRICIERLINSCDNDKVEIATLAVVGEQGFGFHEDDMLFLTESILDELGVKHNLSTLKKLKAIDEYYKGLGDEKNA